MDTQSLTHRVFQAMARHCGGAPADRVAVAISGGSDSVALTLLLHAVTRTSAWQLAGLIHVNHGLRGAESDADEHFCRALAARLDLPIDVTTVDVASRASEAGQSLEVIARDLRYEALAAAAGRLNASLVATGHTLDDQAETVLLRLFRGASLRGVSGIRARRAGLIRPLLDIRRQDLRGYLASLGEPYRDDASNLDVTIERNRLRHEVMPVIERFAPGAARALARFATLAHDDEQFLRQATRDLVTSAAPDVAPTPDGMAVLGTAIAAHPVAALARRAIRAAIERAGGTASFAHIEAIRALAARVDPVDGQLDLTRVSVERRGPALRFWLRPPAARRGASRVESSLPVPGSAYLEGTDQHIAASYLSGDPAVDVGFGGPTLAVVQAASVVLPLAVRSRRPGDRVRPIGAPGSRKVQDVLIDRKIPRNLRDAVPIVVDATGQIVWVAGVVVADRCRVTNAKAGVVTLELQKGNQ